MIFFHLLIMMMKSFHDDQHNDLNKAFFSFEDEKKTLHQNDDDDNEYHDHLPHTHYLFDRTWIMDVFLETKKTLRKKNQPEFINKKRIMLLSLSLMMMKEFN